MQDLSIAPHQIKMFIMTAATIIITLFCFVAIIKILRNTDIAGDR